jgi:hypothetical protein
MLKFICLLKGAFFGKKEFWPYEDARYNDKKKLCEKMFGRIAILSEHIS